MNCNVSAVAAAVVLCTAAASARAQVLGEPRDCVLGPHRVVDVSSAVPGLLEEVTVERSDSVQAGQLVARLESRVEQASLALADAWASIESEVRIEETTRALDRRRKQRISQLYAQRAVALDDKDSAETDAALAALRLRQAQEKRWIRELDARKAEATLERRNVRSPIDGVVVERFRSAGEYVENQPVARIAQLDPLQVETILPMTLFGQVQPGMVAEVRPEHDAGSAHRAVVSVVDRLGDAASGTFGVRLSLANPGNRIPAGLKCSLTFVPGERAPLPQPRTPERPASDVEDHELPASEAPHDRAPDLRIPETTAPEIQAAAPAAEPVAAASATLPVASETHAVETDAPPAADTPLAAAPAEGVPPVELATAQATAACAALGPLDSEADAEALAAALAGRGAVAGVDRRRRSERIGFIVVTPRQDDLAGAKRLAREAEAAGVTDYQVMARGDFVNRVALGVYDGPEMAARRRDQVAARGLVAEVLERNRTRVQWWVHARAPQTVSGDEAFAGLLHDVVVQPRACAADGVHRAGVAIDDDAAS